MFTGKHFETTKIKNVGFIYLSGFTKMFTDKHFDPILGLM